MSLQICSTIAELRSARRAAAAKGAVGLVPTMGALHEGHRSLIRASRSTCATTVVSIFVNPMQFGPNEDFAKYPRTFEADCALLEAEGVEILFAPTVAEIYPSESATYVDVGELGSLLDGASRPGHFRGVATVVMKLFNIVTPDIAYFGQKDAAQVAVLKTMVRDLCVPVRLQVCPTVREADGLALSSRNVYLTPAERTDALSLSHALSSVQQQVSQGVTDSLQLKQSLESSLCKTPAINIDYAEIVDPDTLLPLPDVRKGALVSVAAWVGKTRLIDNILLPSLQNGGDR